jgi:hypothetical protein
LNTLIARDHSLRPLDSSLPNGQLLLMEEKNI